MSVNSIQAQGSKLSFGSISIFIMTSIMVLSSYIYLPNELSYQAWSLSVIFLITLILAITKTFETGVVAFIALSLTLVTGTLSIDQCLSKFNHHVSWLILMAFFISRGIIASGLAKRIAYFLAYFIGSTPLKLSYALICAETILAPFIPSNTARGGGLIYPVAQSLCKELYENSEDKSSDLTEANGPNCPQAFLLYNCFQANIITSALFLTAMAGNPIIASFSSNHGYELTWLTWFASALVPSIICLLATPYLHYYLLDNKNILEKKFGSDVIKKQYHTLGDMSSSEVIMLITFLLLLVSWVFLASIIHPTAAAFVAVTFLLATEVLSWDEIIQDKSAWTTFLWLTTLLMLSSHLKEFGVIDFIAHSLTSAIPFSNSLVVLFLLILINFFSHYFFASLTSHATTILPTFIVIGLSFHIPIAPLVLSLAFSTSLSAGLTHYGTGSAPIFYNAGYWSVKEWWTLGFIHAIFSLAVFCIAGLPLWWTYG